MPWSRQTANLSGISSASSIHFNYTHSYKPSACGLDPHASLQLNFKAYHPRPRAAFTVLPCPNFYAQQHNSRPHNKMGKFSAADDTRTDSRSRARVVGRASY